MVNNIFIRIFNTLSAGSVMFFSLRGYRFQAVFWYCLLIVGMLVGPLGCQRFLYGEGGLLEGESTVNLAVTVPEKPLPVVKPLSVTAEPSATVVVKPPPPLPQRLLPQEVPVLQEPALAAKTSAISTSEPLQARSTVVRADSVLNGRTIREDTVLRGAVLIKGSLVVAPQATLRLEPGASLRFQRAEGSTRNPRLVVQGRLVCAGTPQKPVMIRSVFTEQQVADWGGVLLLSTEKKNLLDYCHIEGAEVGVEAHHSLLSGRGLEVHRTRTGVALYDSVATLQTFRITRSDIGLSSFDSELELRDGTLRENRQGAVINRSSLLVASSRFQANSQEGLVVDQCRFKLSGCSAIDNRVGIVLKGGDGQVQQCRFSLNREAGLSAVGARLKIEHSSFQDNLGVGLVLDGARGSVSQSAFSQNTGGNLQYAGPELFAAVLNWWGETSDARIAEGIKDPLQPNGAGRVSYLPFLTARPALAP